MHSDSLILYLAVRIFPILEMYSAVSRGSSVMYASSVLSHVAGLRWRSLPIFLRVYDVGYIRGRSSFASNCCFGDLRLLRLVNVGPTHTVGIRISLRRQVIGLLQFTLAT